MLSDSSRLAGRYGWAGYGPDGRPLWREWFDNGWTTEGMTLFLERVFRGGPVVPTYMGLIAESGYVSVQPSDVYNTPTTWGEWTQYSGNRPVWNTAPAASATITTSVNANFVMTAAGQLRGAFLATLSSKSFGPGGTLFCTAVAPAPRSVSIGTVVTLYYILGI